MAWGGMNEAGLIISTLNLPRKTKMPISDQRPQLNGPFWVQYQLDNCATVAEVIASDSRVRIAPNEQSHYLVCDKKGNCVVIEFLGGKMVYHTGGDLPVNVLTNSVYKESLEAWRTKKNQSEDSLRRFALAADELGKKHTFTDSRKMVDYAFQVLSLVSRSDTVWSIVFDNQEFQVYFISQGNQQRRWIDFKKLDFSSKTPVQMFDVFSPLAGNINNSLLPYSHQACFEQMKKAFHELVPSLSANDINSLLSTVESFPYAKSKVRRTVRKSNKQ
jgi:choloylglycine hydrolase